jgi:hypothetical protein
VLFDLNQDPGTGNLNLRAYLAAVVGPRRIAHGLREVVQVSPQNPVLIFGNKPQVEVAYVEVWLPEQSIVALPGAGAYIAFASSEGTGHNAIQLLLNAMQRFSAVLLPSDQIYAQAVADALRAALANPVPVVVSSVVF